MQVSIKRESNEFVLVPNFCDSNAFLLNIPIFPQSSLLNLDFEGQHSVKLNQCYIKRFCGIISRILKLKHFKNIRQIKDLEGNLLKLARNRQVERNRYCYVF